MNSELISILTQVGVETEVHPSSKDALYVAILTLETEDSIYKRALSTIFDHALMSWTYKKEINAISVAARIADKLRARPDISIMSGKCPCCEYASVNCYGSTADISLVSQYLGVFTSANPYSIIEVDLTNQAPHSSIRYWVLSPNPDYISAPVKHALKILDAMPTDEQEDKKGIQLLMDLTVLVPNPKALLQAQQALRLKTRAYTLRRRLNLIRGWYPHSLIKNPFLE